MSSRSAAGSAALAAILVLETVGPARADPPIGILGRWSLDLAASHFDEAVTGPAPRGAELDITKDDGSSLAWTLVEEDDSGVAAFQFADARLDGKPVRAVADDHFVPISVTREGPAVVRIRTETSAGPGGEEFVGRLVDPNTLSMEERFTTDRGQGSQSLIFRRVR